MCRLFGMHAGRRPVGATFWLLDAPDSLAEQSHRDPDGTGIGVFEAGLPEVTKQPLAAYADRAFVAAARDLSSTTFVAHVRYTSSSAVSTANTHPFEQDGRLFAHNGVVLGLPELDKRLAELAAGGLVGGQTDSERVFALVTAETRRAGGDLEAGLVAALTWVADHLPVYALNVVLTTATDLWALRYPATHELSVLERPAGGRGSTRHLDARSDRIHARSHDLAGAPAVVVASERMDDDPGWRLLAPGELLHVDRDLAVTSTSPLPERPATLLTLSDLDPDAAASQHPGEAPG